MNSAVSPVSPVQGVLTPDHADQILARGRAVLASESAAIQDAASRLGVPFVEAVRLILSCKGRVCVTGMGKAGLVGAKIQATFASTGTLSYTLHPVDALHGDLGMVHSDDVVVALSKSGGSELVQLLPILKRSGCRVILLTGQPGSEAAGFADALLDIGGTPEACPLGLAPSSSTAAMLALGDALALTVMEVKSIRPEQYAHYHPGGALGRYLMKTREVMRTGANCPTVVETATVAECYEAILRAPKRAGAAVIVDEHQGLVGIVTHGDFFRLFMNQEQMASRPVGVVMTRNPKRIGVDARVMEALAIMSRHAIDELPVVGTGERVVGLIDIQDLIARGFTLLNPT